MPGFQALEWVDHNYVVQWVVPIEGNEKALHLNLSFEKNRKTAMEKAKDLKLPAASLPINLVQGGKGFLTFFPIFAKGQFKGCIMAVFRIQEWLDYIFSVKSQNLLSDNYRISVLFDDIPVYQQAGWEQLKDLEFHIKSSAQILDHNLYLHVRPTQEFFKNNETFLPQLTAMFGILISILISFIVYLFQKASYETWKFQTSKKEVEQEISERNKIEIELQRTLLRTDLATKAAHMGVWTWDLFTDKLNWNEQMFALFDIPSDVTPTYQTWRDALHPDDVSSTQILLEKAVLGKAVFDTEFRILTSKKVIRNIRAAARVLRDAEGKPIYVTGLNWDITKQRNEEEALKKSEAQVRLLLNSTGEAIYGIDLQGNCTFANPSCVRMLGYSDIEALLGKNMHDLIHHSYSNGKVMDVKDCKIYQAFREGKNIHVEDEVLWKADGSSFPVEYWSYPQKIGGDIFGAVVTFIDITERKRLESEREKLISELADLNATKDKFFSIIGHDLRGPLGGFLQITEYLFSNYDSIDDSKKKEIFKLIKDSSSNITALLENLLEWARSQRKTIHPDIQNSDFKANLTKIVHLFQTNANSKKISLELIFTGPNEIQTDQNLLSTILRNLISNALKFTKENGKVTINADTQSDFVKISVKDTGIGMKQQTVDKLFKIESHVSTFGTSGEKGTGLGLILCRELTELLGRSLNLESIVDIGTTFTLMLPKELKPS